LSITAVPGPELAPNNCLACGAHRDDSGLWISLDVDLLDGHAYLCHSCANAVTHASDGSTSEQRALMAETIAGLLKKVEELENELAEERAATVKVVKAEEIVPYLKMQPGRPRKEANV